MADELDIRELVILSIRVQLHMKGYERIHAVIKNYDLTKSLATCPCLFPPLGKATQPVEVARFAAKTYELTEALMGRTRFLAYNPVTIYMAMVIMTFLSLLSAAVVWIGIKWLLWTTLAMAVPLGLLLGFLVVMELLTDAVINKLIVGTMPNLMASPPEDREKLASELAGSLMMSGFLLHHHIDLLESAPDKPSQEG
jgi:hypothetical protein